MENPSHMEPQLDLARWDDLVSSLGDTVVEIAETYLADTPLRIQEITTSVDDRDFESVSRLAHSMKSSSGIFGARQMIERCKELEQAANQQDPSCRQKLESIQAAFNNLAIDLRTRLALMKQ